MKLRRLGPDLFEATKRSGESWVGDAELLKTLPQGIAKLATLELQALARYEPAMIALDKHMCQPFVTDLDVGVRC